MTAAAADAGSGSGDQHASWQALAVCGVDLKDDVLQYILKFQFCLRYEDCPYTSVLDKDRVIAKRLEAGGWWARFVRRRNGAEVQTVTC